MRNRCQLVNCSNTFGPPAPHGVEVGYVINNLTRRIVVCYSCGEKIVQSPRGTWEITAHKELRPVGARPFIIT